MSMIKKLAKNTGYLFLSQILSYLFGFLYVMYSARYLGADDFGIISFALAFTGIIGILADLGLNTLTVREIAREKDLTGRYIGNILIIKIILSIITFGIIGLIINILGYPETTKIVVYLFALSAILGSFYGVFNAIFQAFQEMEYISISTILNSVLLLLITLYAIHKGYDVTAFAFIYFLVNLLIFFYCLFISLTKFPRPKINLDFGFWKFLIKESFPISLATIFTTIAFRIDAVMLSIIIGTLAVGWYSAAYRLMEALIVIPAVFALAIFPLFSKFHKTSKKSLEIAFQKSFKFLFILGLPIAVGTSLLAEQIISIIYQSGYNESIIVLQIVIWAIPFIYISYISRIIFVSINQQNLLFKLNFFAMIINIILNLILIPTLSFIGASIVTVITEMIYFTISYHYLSQFVSNVDLKNSCLKPIIASLTMGLFIILVNINFFLEVLVAAVIYIILLILFKTLNSSDYKILAEITEMITRRNK